MVAIWRWRGAVGSGGAGGGTVTNEGEIWGVQKASGHLPSGFLDPAGEIMMKKKFLLVDGSHYLFRAYFALPRLTAPDGHLTGVVYGVIAMLKKLYEVEKPDYFAVIFDAPGRNFRHEIFPEYKANRSPTPEDLSQQFAPTLELVSAMGYPVLQVPDVEADDVIATLARQPQGQKVSVVIATGDKDLAQLVDDEVMIYEAMKNVHLDAAAVEKKMGVPPCLVGDFLGLTGDSADNVPGVSGVGPKTAINWLGRFGSLEGVVQYAAQIKGKVGEKLRLAIADGSLALSRRLITLRTDVELERGYESMQVEAVDVGHLRELYQRHGFKRWLSEIESAAAVASAETEAEGTAASAEGKLVSTVSIVSSGEGSEGSPPEATAAPADGKLVSAALDCHYETILTEAELEAWIVRLRESALFAVDTETDGLDYMSAQLVGMSFAVAPGRAAYVPCGHDYPDAPRQITRDNLLRLIKPVLEDPGVSKVGHNLKFDRNVLASYGISLDGIRSDTMLESYVYNSVATRHSLDSVAHHYLGLAATRFEDVVGSGVKQKTFNQIALSEAVPYASQDADFSLRLHESFQPKFANEAGLRTVLHDIELPLLSVIADVERSGVLVDCEALKAQSEQLHKEQSHISQLAYEAAGHEFNLNSPQATAQVLFQEKQLPVIRKTPKGLPATSEEVLHELAKDHVLPNFILEHRLLSKLKSTYTDKLPQLVHPATGRVHTQYHQAVTATGRLSSSRPNLQNIPVRTEAGRRVREAFIAPSGYCLLAADYSQIELRIMAHLSSDEKLCEAFARKEDVHGATAAEIFSIPVAAVTSEHRRIAKSINFGLIYGMTEFGLSRHLKLSRREAADYRERYFARYSGVQDYMEATLQEAKRLCYVETVFGRRLSLPNINARNYHVRSYAERSAINAPMQGTAADIIKVAMIDLHRYLTHSSLDAKIIMQIHDELVLEVALDEVEETAGKCRELMVAAASLDVPLEVGIGWGENWNVAH